MKLHRDLFENQSVFAMCLPKSSNVHDYKSDKLYLQEFSQNHLNIIFCLAKSQT